MVQSSPRLTLRARTRWLAFLVFLLTVLVILDDYQGWRLLLLALGGTWLLAWLWARSLGRGLSVQREMRFGWTQVGDRMEERFTLTNRSPLPALWVQIEDHSNLPEYPASLVTGLEGSSSNNWRIHGLCSRRGLYTVGPTTLRTADPFGLYSVEIFDPRSASLMVTPPVVPLPQIEVAPGGRAGQGRPRPNAPERTVSVEGVRQYLPGDSLRWVHWRTSARRDELHVRLFESTPSGDWWIILDLEDSVQAGEGARSTEEHGVILAASLADRGLRLGRQVGLIAHGDSLAWLAPRQGDNQRWEILRRLALLKPGERPLESVLQALQPSFNDTASLILITPATGGKWISSLLPLIWKGSQPTVLLLDAVSFKSNQELSAADSNPATRTADELHRWGAVCHVVTPELLDRPEAQPGRRGRFEWRVSPTGRAVLVNPPRDASWRSLA